MVTSVLAKKFIGNIHKAFVNVQRIVFQICISTRRKGGGGEEINSMLQSLTSRQKNADTGLFCTKRQGPNPMEATKHSA